MIPMPYNLEGACADCVHLTDVFWDYTEGPYMWVCDLNIDAPVWACLFREVENEHRGL